MSQSSMIKKTDAIKEGLLQRKRELEAGIKQLQLDNDVSDQIQDSGDQAISSAFESLKSSLHNNEYEEFKMIEKALEMIEAGSYGMCVDCQEAISEKRLKSYPNATRCILCQEKVEEENQKNYTNSYF